MTFWRRKQPFWKAATTQWQDCLLVSPRVVLPYLLQGNRGEAGKLPAGILSTDHTEEVLQLPWATSSVGNSVLTALGLFSWTVSDTRCPREAIFWVPSPSHTKRLLNPFGTLGRPPWGSCLGHALVDLSGRWKCWGWERQWTEQRVSDYLSVVQQKGNRYGGHKCQPM